MSEKIDRRIGSNGSNGFLIMAAVVIFIVALAAGSYLFLRMEQDQASQTAEPLSPPQPSYEDSFMITLFMPVDDALSAEPIAVRRQPDTQTQAREALIAALADERTAQSPVLKELKLKELFFDASGTAYVDLIPVPEGGIRASAADEHLALYAIVNLLMMNFEEIKQVRVLVNGREAESLAGHIDLSGAFRTRADLVKP